MKKTKVMNKSFILIFLMLLLSALVFFPIVSTTSATVKASSVTIENSADGIEDSYLYNALISQYRKITGIVDTSTITSEMFINVTSIDLSNSNISSLKGLEKINLSTVTSLNLASNNISTISSYLTSLTNLNTLNLSNNNLTVFNTYDLPFSSKNALTTINLSNNKIQQSNLTGISATVDLSFNNISDIKDITYTEENGIIYLSHNNINLPGSFDITNLDLGFQGTSISNKFYGEHTINFYSLSNVTKITIYKNESQIAELVENQQIVLGLGNYEILFFNNETESTVFNSINISVVPNAPAVKLFQNNAEIEYTNYLTANTVFKFEGLENATFKYKLNNEEYVVASEVELTKEGTNILRIVQIVDGIESDETILWLTIRHSTVLSWIYILAGIVLFVSAFFGIRFWLNKPEKKSSNKNKKLD